MSDSTEYLRLKYPQIIGQKSALKKLDFFTEIQSSNGYFPFVLMVGSRGSGKTETAASVSKHLFDKTENTIRKSIKINCSTIESVSSFFTEIVDIYCLSGEINLIMDEFHSIASVKNLVDTFLTIFDTNNDINLIPRNGQNYQFDKSKISWICLTSEPHLLPETLISRMEVINLEMLSLEDLTGIIKKNLQDIQIQDEQLLTDIASVSRANGRESFKLAENIKMNLKISNKNTLTKEDWEKVKSKLGIRKFGLNNTEFKILKFLQSHSDGASLSKISSSLQLTQESCRLGFERFLLGNDFIQIEAGRGRVLTKKGYEYLSEVKE